VKRSFQLEWHLMCLSAFAHRQKRRLLKKELSKRKKSVEKECATSLSLSLVMKPFHHSIFLSAKNKKLFVEAVFFGAVFLRYLIHLDHKTGFIGDERLLFFLDSCLFFLNLSDCSVKPRRLRWGYKARTAKQFLTMILRLWGGSV